MTRILAVCAGNICRSPAAEAAIAKAAHDSGLVVEVDSAGTGSWHVGSVPHPQSVAAGARVGLEVTGRARTFIATDYDRFDMIVVMDHANQRDVLSLARSPEDRAKVRLFRTFDPDTEEQTVPDPYGGSDADYDRAVGQIMAAANGLISQLAAQR